MDFKRNRQYSSCICVHVFCKCAAALSSSRTRVYILGCSKAKSCSSLQVLSFTLRPVCQSVSLALSRLHVTRYLLRCHIITASRVTEDVSWLTNPPVPTTCPSFVAPLALCALPAQHAHSPSRHPDPPSHPRPTSRSTSAGPDSSGSQPTSTSAGPPRPSLQQRRPPPPAPQSRRQKRSLHWIQSVSST